MNFNQRQSLLDQNHEYQSTLRAQGHYLDGNSNAVTTLHFDQGTIAVTADPLSCTKIAPVDIFILEALDLNHAIALLSGLPCMRPGGCMEIRPIS